MATKVSPGCLVLQEAFQFYVNFQSIWTSLFQPVLVICWAIICLCQTHSSDFPVLQSFGVRPFCGNIFLNCVFREVCSRMTSSILLGCRLLVGVGYIFCPFVIQVVGGLKVVCFLYFSCLYLVHFLYFATGQECWQCFVCCT